MISLQLNHLADLQRFSSIAVFDGDYDYGSLPSILRAKVGIAIAQYGISVVEVGCNLGGIRFIRGGWIRMGLSVSGPLC